MKNQCDEEGWQQPPDIPRAGRKRRVNVLVENGEPQPSRRPSDERRYHEDDRHQEREPDAFDGRPEGPSGDFAPPLPNNRHGATSMWKLLYSFFLPPLDDNPENIRRHRMALSLAVIALSGLMTAAFGYLPLFGFSGFASAASVTDIKVELLEQRIFDTRIRWCAATSTESRQFYGQKEGDLLLKYFQLTHSNFPLPGCEEIR